MIDKQKHRPNIRNWRTIVSVLIALLALYLIGARLIHIWPFEVAAKTASAVKTTSKAASAQSDFTNGGKKNNNKTPEPSTDNSATDTGGTLPDTTSASSTWNKSSDGTSIIVMNPASGSLFSSGDTLYGTATSDSVSYELEDDVTGVILQGQASVVNGKFSIKLAFSTSGTNGRINVFNQASDGTETNNVSIDVRLK